MILVGMLIALVGVLSRGPIGLELFGFAPSSVVFLVLGVATIRVGLRPTDLPNESAHSEPEQRATPRSVPKELAIVVWGAGVGVGLFAFFGTWLVCSEGAICSRGLPFAWKWYATGFPPPPSQLILDLDFVFWVAIGVVFIELLYRRILSRYFQQRI